MSLPSPHLNVPLTCASPALEPLLMEDLDWDLNGSSLGLVNGRTLGSVSQHLVGKGDVSYEHSLSFRGSCREFIRTTTLFRSTCLNICLALYRLDFHLQFMAPYASLTFLKNVASLAYTSLNSAKLSSLSRLARAPAQP